MSEPYNPPMAPPPSGPPAYGRPGLPWDREKTGNALVDTAKRLITAPGAAFEEVREKGDYMSPVLFAVILGTVGAVIGQIWNLIFGGVMNAWMIGVMPMEMRDQMAAAMAPTVAGVVFGIVLAPIFVLIGVFVGGAIYHLFLLLVGGTKESTAGFEGTVRSVSYASVASLAQIVPFVGPMIGLVWGIVLNVIGLSRIHRTTTGRSLAAVLLPWLVCCICLIIFVVTMMGTIMAAIGANQ